MEANKLKWYMLFVIYSLAYEYNCGLQNTPLPVLRSIQVMPYTAIVEITVAAYRMDVSVIRTVSEVVIIGIRER